MKNKAIAFLSMIMLVASTVFGATTVKLVNVHFISTGNSDSILIEDNGKYALIDGADNDDESVIVNYLNSQGVKELEYLILTHPDADHCGGLDAVVKNFTIKNVFVGNGNADTKTYQDFYSACINKQLQPSVPLQDKTFTLGNGSFQFFNQTSQRDNANDNSLVALYTIGSNKFLFMGDSGKEVEADLPLDKIGKVDVLKVGHHGSKSSSSDSFIKSVSPKNAVICCGKNNKYGHPHQETLDVLSKNNIATYRTDLNGTVIAMSDGKNVTIKTSNTASQDTISKSNNGNSSSTNNKKSTTPTTTNNNPSKTVDTSNNKSQTVYVTKTGKKYHQDGCASLSKSKIAINKDDAEKEGYTPCSKCNP